MTVDSSAVLAVLLHEADAKHHAEAIMTAMPCRMSVANVLESRGGTAASHELDVFLERAEVELMPVTVEHLVAAQRAWRRFGKGNHPPAALNFGDCFAYVLADTMGEPLLFKGNDFARTDIKAV